MDGMERELLRTWVLDVVWEEYRTALGRTIEATSLLALNTRYLDTEAIELSRPARVRVHETQPSDLDRRVGARTLAPLWAVELVEPHPELADAADLLLWIRAPAYSLETGERVG